MTEPVNGASRKATEVDRTVGAALKRFRRYRGLTQVELGERVDKSYKQIRKYEYGQNRIAASTLHKLAVALEIEVADLFADLPAPDTSHFQSFDAEIREMATAFTNITNAKQRKAFLAMVREYAESGLND